MKQMGHHYSMRRFFLLLVALFVIPSTTALNVGPSALGVSKDQECSRTCESDNCSVPPLLRYGKYCGILYSGCPGEKPCDGLDACCMAHDNCVASKNNDYLSTECSSNLLDCMGAYKDGPTFDGNKCMITEVIDVITIVIEAALLAGRVLHKP